MKKRILVSACLLGFQCNYKGVCAKEYTADPFFWNKVIETYEIIPVCPEQLGGLSTPRIPSELLASPADIFNGKAKVVSKTGDDVTHNFIKGANEALHIAKLANISFAVMKSRSPSCGKGQIYDGTFSGALVNGSGLTAFLLGQNDFLVYTEDEFLKIAKI